MNGEYQLLIDTWEGQLELDEATLLANGVAGMLIRLNDMNGGHHMDENFVNQWAQAKAFCRAPYFVYNPWVDGVANYIWLASQMPADAKAVMLDIEVRMSGYSPATYAAEVRKFHDLVKSKWATVIYTGEWFLPMLSSWPTDADYWWAQYPLEFYQEQDIHLTWDELRTRLQRYDKPFNVSKVPGRLRMWQFTGDTLVLPGSARIIDVNVFYGSCTDLENLFGKPAVSQPPPAADVITSPFVGVQRITGKRHGWKFELFISDPARVDFEVLCLPNLETVSSAAKRKGASLGFNGGEWDRKSKPKDYSVGNGVVCIDRVQAVPSLMVLKNKSIVIDHRNTADVRHALSGLRYLIREGVIQGYLSGTEPQYTEGHAHSIQGLNAAGFHMCLTSEGVYPNQGLTLKQCAELMKQYGAATAFDSGGGGDAGVVMKDVLLTVPENINPATGQHFERPLPQVLLAYAQETDPMPEPTENYYLYTATGNRAIRSGPGATFPRIASYSDFLFATTAKGGATAADRATLTAEQAVERLGSAGDVWVKVYDNNGKAVTGWTASTHKGVQQITEKLVTVIPPPTAEDKVTIIEEHADGSKRTLVITGKLTVT